MKKLVKNLVVIISFLILSLFITSDRIYANYELNEVKTRDLSEIVGVTHVSGAYYFTDKNFLNEGADKLEELGTKVIKIWLTQDYQNSYLYNSDWPKLTSPLTKKSHDYPNNWDLNPEYRSQGVNSLVDLLKTSYYQDLLSVNRSFTTYVFETTEFGKVNWKDGLTILERNDVYNQFYELTAYLMTSQKGTNRTFLLQNWEGDNALRAWELSEDQLLIASKGMIDWLNARQAGITDARNDVLMEDPTNDIKVYGVAEVNRVNSTKEQFNHPLVVDIVVPYTNMDLYSLSSWGTRLPGEEKDLIEKLDYIAEKAPDSEDFGNKNVMLGEFGSYEDTHHTYYYPQYVGDTGTSQYVSTRKQLEFALEWGVPYAIYWQLYCNGVIDNKKLITDDNGYKVATNDNLRGVWLIRADGSITPTWEYLQNLFKKHYINDDLKDLYNIYAYTENLSLINNTDITITDGDNTRLVNNSSLSGYITYKLDGNIEKIALKVYHNSLFDYNNFLKVYISNDNKNWQKLSLNDYHSKVLAKDNWQVSFITNESVNGKYLRIELQDSSQEIVQLGSVVVYTDKADLSNQYIRPVEINGIAYGNKAIDNFDFTTLEYHIGSSEKIQELIPLYNDPFFTITYEQAQSLPSHIEINISNGKITTTYNVKLFLFGLTPLEQLEQALEKAKDLIDNTLPGTTPGRYSQQEKIKLINQYNKAKTIFNNSNSSLEKIEEALMLLNEAILRYEATKIPEVPIEEEKPGDFPTTAVIICVSTAVIIVIGLCIVIKKTLLGGEKNEI